MASWSKHLYCGFLVLACTTGAFAETAVQQCGIVYSTATRNISISESSYSSLNSIYDDYCSASGETNVSSSSIGIDAVIKSIPVKFSGNQGNNSQRMQNFCRTYSEVRYSSSASSAQQDTVVVEALQSFNDCLKIAGNGVLVELSTTNGTNSSFSFQFGSGVKYELQGVVPERNIECSMRLGADSDPISLDKNSYVNIDRNFSINCVRIPIPRDDGSQFLPRTSVIIASNQGPYSAVFPAEEILDVEYATMLAKRMSSIEDRAAAIANDLRKYVDENNENLASLKEKLQVKTFLAFTGEKRESLQGEWLYAGRESGTIDGWAKQACGNLKTHIQPISEIGGNCCGYVRYVVSCYGFE